MVITKAMDESGPGDIEFARRPMDFQQEFDNFENILHGNSEHNKMSSSRVGAGHIVEEDMGLDKLEEATRGLHDAAKSSERVKCDIEEKQLNIEAVRKNVEDLVRGIELSAQSAQEFSEAAKGKEAETKALLARLRDKGDVIGSKKEKLKTELKRWKQVLGLEIQTTTKPSTAFVFTNIEREEPDRKFCFELGLEKGRYKVDRCEPPLAGLDGIVELLNKTNDLSGFVVTLRRKFSGSLTN